MGKPSGGSRSSTVARDVFAQRGYHAAKIDDIVAAAGIARGTFYLYFEDKRAIFEEIVDRDDRAPRHGHRPRRSRTTGRAPWPTRSARTSAASCASCSRTARTTKILLSDALGVDPTFDRKLLSFYDEMSNAPRATA